MAVQLRILRRQPQCATPEKLKPADIMTLTEVAKYLRTHPTTIYRLLKKKQIPALRLGKEWRFSRERIDNWVKDLVRTSTTAPLHRRGQ
jgi:excisionase family DNA binding protein